MSAAATLSTKDQLAQSGMTLGDFIAAHEPAAALLAYFVVTNFISALPAPTVKNGQLYIFFFKFVNGLGGNIARAYSTQIEHSPNFAAAVTKFNNSQPKEY